jgi:hypothetical protein
MAIQSYPLCWPEGWKRTRGQERKFGHFNKTTREYTPGGNSWSKKRDLTVSDGVDRVLSELTRFGADRQDIIVSTNVRTRLDGMPRSGEREPDDPGAAVYWKTPGDPMRCMAVDRYTTVADNLAAIAATIEAMRAIERHGGAQILDRAFTGFAALPEKATSPWRNVLGFADSNGRSSVSVTPDEVKQRYREMVRTAHPDVGGDAEEFRRLTEARDIALRELQESA